MPSLIPTARQQTSRRTGMAIDMLCVLKGTLQRTSEGPCPRLYAYLLHWTSCPHPDLVQPMTPSFCCCLSLHDVLRRSSTDERQATEGGGGREALCGAESLRWHVYRVHQALAGMTQPFALLHVIRFPLLEDEVKALTPRADRKLCCVQLWNLMPMDPMSWVVLYNAHHDALADLIASNMRHRLPPESLRQTPAASVRARVAGGALSPMHEQSAACCWTVRADCHMELHTCWLPPATRQHGCSCTQS